ncbi:hypothetical protein GGS21DRAFT_239661 [Xylaria nigripes]|nr:hypothetical protein GGS21DRAFT_239661 [Xylaria nigripes]
MEDLGLSAAGESGFSLALIHLWHHTEVINNGYTYLYLGKVCRPLLWRPSPLFGEEILHNSANVRTTCSDLRLISLMLLPPTVQERPTSVAANGHSARILHENLSQNVEALRKKQIEWLFYQWSRGKKQATQYTLNAHNMMPYENENCGGPRGKQPRPMQFLAQVCTMFYSGILSTIDKYNSLGTRANELEKKCRTGRISKQSLGPRQG